MSHCKLCKSTRDLINYGDEILCVDCAYELDTLFEYECVNYGHNITTDNVYSYAGLREVHISGLCELCFDKITME